MLSSISGGLFGAQGSPPKSDNVNMAQRASRKSAKKSPGSETAQEKLIESLKNEAKIKDAAIAALSSKIDRLEDEKRSGEAVKSKRGKHPLSTVSHIISDTGRQKVRMGTRGSLLTQNILEAAAEPRRCQEQKIAEKFLQVFQNPVNFISYVQSEQFAMELIALSRHVSTVFEEQPRVIFLQSPLYVFGDIHGNLEDLHFFSDNLWRLGMDLAAGKFLFLGDYVDRGMSCLECVAYLFGLKILYPDKITLLRGNHETRDVNGWEEHYMEKSFFYQCKDRFGLELGETLWEEVNLAFDRMPLAAVVDNEIFCIHGGIPRPIPAATIGEQAVATSEDGRFSEIQAIMALPEVISVMPPYEHEEDWMRQLATDCIWADPASEDMESRLDHTGFGDSPRGGGAICFGSKAIDNFLEKNGLSYIIRAHEAHAHGVSLSKGARVFTVFSTSKDHRQGERAMAGCILIDTDKIQVINRSPKYKNKYVHRRTSVSLENLTPEQMEERRKLGLVRFSLAMEDMTRLINQAHIEADDDDDVADAKGYGSGASSPGSKGDIMYEEAGEKGGYSHSRTHKPSF